MERTLTPKQKRIELESLKAELETLQASGDVEAYRKLVATHPAHYYLVNFSNEELLASEELLDYLGANLRGGYKALIVGRDDETAMNIIEAKKQAIVKAAMKYPEVAEPVISKMLVRKNVGTQDFVGYESQVAQLSPMIQDVIANPEEVWKICDSVQVMMYNVPKGKEWEVLDWLAENDADRFRMAINAIGVTSYSKAEVIERYSRMPADKVPVIAKAYLEHIAKMELRRVETNKKLAEIWHERVAERKASWLDSDGRLVQFFKLEDGFPITSKEDYLFIADVFKNSEMTAYGFCKQYKIDNIEGFRKMLKKVAENDPEFAEFYEAFSKRKTEQFVQIARKDILGVATKRLDVAEIIDESTENRDFKKLVDLAKRLFDSDMVATKFVENVISYYHDRANSYGEYSTDEADLQKRLTYKEIQFLVGEGTIKAFRSGKTIDFGAEINDAIRPVMSQLGRDTRVRLYDGRTGVRVRLKPYSTRFERDRYLKETVEFLTSDGRGVSVKESMVDNAECFVDEHDLFRSASVMTRIIKSVAEGKLQNQQQTQEYQERLKNQIMVSIKDVRTLEEYFGVCSESRPETQGQVVALLN